MGNQTQRRAAASAQPLRQAVSDFGVSPQAAIRTLIEAFAIRGWAGSVDASTGIIRLLNSSTIGVTPSKAAAAAGRQFLARNGISQSKLAELLIQIGNRSGV